MKRFFLACILLFSLPAFAQVDGEVRKVDRDAQKLTIRHGPLPQLDMPQPMTMVYRVKEAGRDGASHVTLPADVVVRVTGRD